MAHIKTAQTISGYFFNSIFIRASRGSVVNQPRSAVLLKQLLIFAKSLSFQILNRDEPKGRAVNTVTQT